MRPALCTALLALLPAAALLLPPPQRAVGRDADPEPAQGVGFAPSLKLPAEVKAAPATITEVVAETEGKTVRWVPLTPGLSMRPCGGGKVLLVSGPVGRYELLAYTAVGDVPSDPARTVVVIEGGPQPPPPDELRRKLSDAFAKDKPARADAVQLAAIYRQAAQVALDPDVPHSQELLRRLRDVSTALLGPDALAATRGVIAEALVALAGMSSTDPFTDVRRQRKADFFNRVASTLEELAK